MTTADTIRNGIIDKLLTISDKDYLNALYELITKSSIDKGNVKLTEEQLTMLNLSEKDIEHGRLVSQAEIDKNDLEWLKGQGR